MKQLAAQCLAERPTMSPSQWCCENLVFDEAGNHGPFRITGCEYVRDVLDDFARTDVADEVLVWGSQTRKTGTLMGGVSWAISNDPSGIFWVMPNRDLARRFSRQRFMPLLRASAPLARLIPSGADRHSFSTLEMILGASTINFAGSNSPANIASFPARRVVQDEVDKFHEGGESSGESDASNLADQRAKDKPMPQRWKTSTPTTPDRLIWTAYLKGDQRRYFVPCPNCSRHVVFGWSEDFTMLPKIGCEAWVSWDKESKSDAGAWDFERVKRSAHATCPHCQGRIGDEHKTRMVRDGEWRPTNPGAPRGYVSRHLSSLYATSPETTFGVLAVKFLQAKESPEGPRGFINGDLAEVFENQDTRQERFEAVSAADAAPLTGGIPMMTFDVQATAPYFWCVVRSWDPTGNSRLLGAYSCDDWETLRRIQLHHGALDNFVLGDSGDRTAEVYKECLRWGKIAANVHIGWTPAKGREAETLWKDKKTGKPLPWMMADAPLDVGDRRRLLLFQFNGEFILDILARLRRRKGGMTWEVAEFPVGPEIDGATRVDADTYWRHMDAKIYKPEAVGRTHKVKWRWVKRSRKFPDHLLDCEIMQCAWAIFHRRLPWAAPEGGAK